MMLMTPKDVKKEKTAKEEQDFQRNMELGQEIEGQERSLNEIKDNISLEKDQILDEHNLFVDRTMRERKDLRKEIKKLNEQKEEALKPVNKCIEEAEEVLRKANARHINLNIQEAIFKDSKREADKKHKDNLSFIKEQRKGVARLEKQTVEILNDATAKREEAIQTRADAREVRINAKTIYDREIARKESFLKALEQKHRDLTKEVKELEKKKKTIKLPSNDEVSVLMRETKARDKQCRADYKKLDSTRAAIMAEYDLFKRKNKCIHCNNKYEA